MISSSPYYPSDVPNESELELFLKSNENTPFVSVRSIASIQALFSSLSNILSSYFPVDPATMCLSLTFEN